MEMKLNGVDLKMLIYTGSEIMLIPKNFSRKIVIY